MEPKPWLAGGVVGVKLQWDEGGGVDPVLCAAHSACEARITEMDVQPVVTRRVVVQGKVRHCEPNLG